MWLFVTSFETWRCYLECISNTRNQWQYFTCLKEVKFRWFGRTQPTFSFFPEDTLSKICFTTRGDVIIFWSRISGLMRRRPRMPLLTSISNYTHYKVWNEITYPFPNCNGCAVEVWERKSNIIHILLGICLHLSMLELTLRHCRTMYMFIILVIWDAIALIMTPPQCFTYWGMKMAHTLHTASSVVF